MDGTGLLFKPFLNVCPKNLDYSIIPLMSGTNQRVIDQAKVIEKAIGDFEVILVAESYSSILAYELAQRNHIRISKIIFVAGFLGQPSIFSKFSSVFPLSLINVTPNSVLGFSLFGRHSTNALVALFRQSIDSSDRAALKKRLSNIANLKEASLPLKMPCVYIQPSQDQLVSSKCIKVFERLCEHLDIELVEGTHFVMQTNPQAVADIVLQNAGV